MATIEIVWLVAYIAVGKCIKLQNICVWRITQKFHASKSSVTVSIGGGNSFAVDIRGILIANHGYFSATAPNEESSPRK